MCEKGSVNQGASCLEDLAFERHASCSVHEIAHRTTAYKTIQKPHIDVVESITYSRSRKLAALSAPRLRLKRKFFRFKTFRSLLASFLT